MFVCLLLAQVASDELHIALLLYTGILFTYQQQKIFVRQEGYYVYNACRHRDIRLS